MSVLITGGAGFLGSALANRLVAQGSHVRVLDDLSAGERERLDPRVAFCSGDTRDIPKLWSLLRGVDCVYHLAARVSVPESVLYPVEYNDVNVGGTVSLLTAMRDAQVKRLVFASSGAIYGEQERQPIAEDAPLRPLTPYAVSKVASEQYVRAIGNLWGIETVILRIFNAYGPGQPLPPSHASVIPRFLKQATSGGSLVVFGDGTQTRDFVYIDDVVDALVAAGQAEGISRSIINIGSGREVSIGELVETIERVLGESVHRLCASGEKAGVTRLVADVDLARRTLGYTPRVSLEEGLQRTIARDGRFSPR
ncbi:MAG TPA: NAD-dependent epimerase/dehydratase family protein [Chloroflexi bacterium]|jgi:UDP-glucose 4-epimerase|nr:NAD-dependent epimerase/dehydratase family protein [Chloroflexota bacterium]